MTGRIRAWLLLSVFGLMVMPAAAVQAVLLIVNEQWASVFVNAFYRVLLRVIGWRLRLFGRPRCGPLVLWVSNHTSWLDILVLGSVSPVRFVAKSEVSRWPFFGVLARLTQTVFVDRNRRQASIAASKAIRQALAGHTLVLFPEATSSDGNSVLPFRSALFSATEREPGGLQVLVQPVSMACTGRFGIPLGRRQRYAISWYGDMMLGASLLKVLGLGPLEITIMFHEPIPADMAGGRKQLAAVCESKVRSGLALILSGRLASGAKRDSDAPLSMASEQNP